MTRFSLGALLVASIILLLCSAADGGDKLIGTVTYVRDGDTVVVRGRPVRLRGITCDERGTALGDLATEAMEQLVAGRTLICRLTGDRNGDREIGHCRISGGEDVASALIERGLCGRCARYDTLGLYKPAQRRAGEFRGSLPTYCYSFAYPN